MQDKQTVNVTINNKNIKTYAGKTIIEVCRENNIEIPALCNLPTLVPLGSCRLCVVEVKNRGIVASCTEKVCEGMIVETHSSKVINHRKNILELILSDHPYDCMTCEKSGECLLEKYAYEYGIKKVSFEGEKGRRLQKDGSPFIVRDYEKCILCGRCVSVCEEVIGVNAIDYAYRGFLTTINSGFDESLAETECVFCGNCIEVCPVGALREVSAENKGRTWEYKKIETVCPYCGVGCGLVVYVKDNKIVKIKGNANSPVNKGFLCVKGKFGFEYVFSEHRIKSPLIKTNGEFKEVSWDEALNFIYEKLTFYKDKYGSDSIAALASAKCTNEENYIFQKFFRSVIKTSNIDHCARLCHSSTIAGLAQTLGTAAMSNSFAEIEEISDCMIITGTNVSESQPVTSYKIRNAKRNGAKIIVIDPREVEISKYADIYIQPKYGTDVLVFNAIAKIIIEKKLYDEKFINERVEGFEEFRKQIEHFDLKEVETVANVRIADLEKVAEIYSKAKAAVILWAMGITQHTTGTDNVISLSNLALLTGQIGKPGAGLCPLRGQNNVQGACDMGALPEFYPGYNKATDETTIEKFKKLWNIESLPDKVGLTVVEMFNGIIEGQIKAMYIMGEMPLVSEPDILHAREALKKADFLVVQDILFSEVAEYADVILPALCSFEKDGTFTNTERRVQKIEKCIKNFTDAKPDWEIIKLLADKFGCKWDYKSVWDILSEINRTVESYRGITPERIKKGERLQWPCLDENHQGTKTIHIGVFKRGKGLLKYTGFKEPFELPDKEYPFLLTTGRLLSEYHSRSMTGRVEGIKKITGTPFLIMNDEDAQCHNIKNGEKIRIISRRGQVELITKLSEEIQKGVIFIPFHFCANLLTHTQLDPYSKIPEYKCSACKIEKIDKRKRT